MRGNKWVASSRVLAACAVFATPARAEFFSSSSGSLSASVNFEINSDGDLVVTLTNTSSADVMNPAQILTAVFFSVPGSGLAPVSANVASGSWVNNEGAVGAANFPDVDGEWAFAYGINAPGGANAGISSSGLGLFGPGDVFGTPNLAGPAEPDGLQYGITSAGDDPDSGNTPVTTLPLIQNSVVFILSGWNENWSLSDIGDVFFQYGTSLDEPRLGQIPEPGVIALLGVGLVGLVFGMRKLGWA